MFWKNASWFSRLSITVRLTILYTLSTLLILSLAMFFLNWALIGNLKKDSAQLLFGELTTIQDILEKNSGHFDSLKQEIVFSPNTQMHRYYARLLDADGKVLMATSGMRDRIPASRFPQASQQTFMPSRIASDHRSNEHYYRLVSQWVRMDNQSPLLLQVAVDVLEQHQVIVRHRWNMLWVFLISMGCAISLGVLLVEKGMKHLLGLTRIMGQVTGNQLQNRIDAKSWPKELTTVASAFNQMLDRIENAFERLEQFSGNLAHEMRTPVNNLMGEAQIALSRDREVSHYKEILGSSLEELDRLSSMIERLLFLARADNPKAHIKKEVLDIAEEFSAICDFYEALAEEQGVVLHQGGKGRVQADPILFRRAINNLVSNALKHTETGNTITLSTVTKGGAVHIVVTDTGSGIPSRHLSRLGERFYRVDAARSKALGGTGLGLAIVNSIMLLHHGTMAIESEFGAYTRVTLIFPNR